MRFATRILLGALVLVLAGSAQAQDKNVTFQVDMSPYITTCQFVAGTSTVKVVGSVNGWDTANDDYLLADADEDGTYTGTFPFAESTALAYKFYADPDLGYEDNTGDRTYTVAADADQSIDMVTFADPDPVDNCIPAEKKNIEVLFSVDMNVAEARGTFNPATQKIYVAGALSDWGGAAGKPEYELAASSTETGVYTGLIQFSDVPVGSTQPYKFITHDGTTIGWESSHPTTDNYEFVVPETLTDGDSNGFFEVAADSRFFSLVDFNQVLEAPATVTFRVDLRPAESYIAANASGLPFEAGEAVTAITGLFLNGPAMWEATENGGPGGGMTDWAAWSADGLGAMSSVSFTEDTSAPGFWELTLNYPIGALRTLVGKLGVNAFDNEADTANDGFYEIVDGSTITHVFGAMRKKDGTFVDDDGPDGAGTGAAVYDPYILIDNTATPPTAMWVASGGESDILVSIEDGPSITGLAIGAAYPNPTHGLAKLDLTLDRALDLRVALYDVVGRQVATLADGPVAAGETTVEMDVADLSPGVYLLRVEADGQAVVRRMTVLR